MKILAIETSCDDTGISVLDVKEDKKSPEFSVLSNVIASQVEIGKKYGGVYPAMAKREHQRNLVPVLSRALKQAKLQNSKSEIRNPKQIQNNKFQKLNEILLREPELQKQLIPFLKKYTPRGTGAKPDIDLISVTNGPGLEPCLWVGVNFAKALSYFWDIPIVPVNHIESHILVNFLTTSPVIPGLTRNPGVRAHTLDSGFRQNDNTIKFPAICLVISGGHTQLILMKKIGDYKILGETRDDAAGECFDKCAKLLGLGYPGGPIIAKLAEKNVGRPTSHKLPRPMINTKDYDFSFSGLKTAVLYYHQKQDKKTQKSKKYIINMCAEVQQAIIDVLIKKTMKAVKDFNAKSLILGGGVSANTELRKQFTQISNIPVIFPETNLSTDNGLMTAIAGYFHKKNTVDWKSIQANGNLRIGE